MHKCIMCCAQVKHNINGQVEHPFGMTMARCNRCLGNRFTCSGCKVLFDPNEEGVVGDIKNFCGECCNTLDADENLIDDMADRMANGSTFLEA